MGKAYGFFDLNARKEEIKREIPLIRESSKTPEKLELILTKDIDSLNVGSDLLQIEQELDPKYVIEATCPDYTNEQTAHELSAILNNTYQSLHQTGEPFRGEVVYEKNGGYVSIE